tara:strand:+ start:126 stop:233 length:108 start_codon:yes stop_codon:yes gene_type:complete
MPPNLVIKFHPSKKALVEGTLFIGGNKIIKTRDIK